MQRAWDGWRRWSRTALQERIAFLIRLAKLLEERAETYGRPITAEMGKPLADAIGEIKKSALDARYFAEAGEAYLKPQPVPGLRWDDIQFGESQSDPNRYILIRRNFGLGEFTNPKSRKERRVDLNRQLRQVLLELGDQRMLGGDHAG